MASQKRPVKMSNTKKAVKKNDNKTECHLKKENAQCSLAMLRDSIESFKSDRSSIELWNPRTINPIIHIFYAP
jgi:hypothetical protein